MLETMTMDINMWMVIIYVIIGAFAGILAGLNPSVNVTITILIFYPILISLDVYSIIAFYLGVLVTSQYMGSVIASTVGIPGEASSIPAVKEGYSMNMQGKLTQALRTSAIASGLGSMIAVALIILTVSYLSYLHIFYALTLQLILLSGCIVISTITASNRLVISASLMAIGYTLGAAGITQTRENTWFTDAFNVTDPYFMEGIPIALAFIFFYALPTLLGNKFDQGKVINAKQDSKHFKLSEFAWWSTVRGSVIGFFAGLIPSLTFTISSQLAYSFEKLVKRKSYKKGDDRCLAAAESANNSATMSFLLPLLVFGIPISASEILIYDMVVDKGAQFGLEWVSNATIINALVVSFIIANVIGFISAWPLAALIGDFVHRHDKKIFWLALTMLTITIINVGLEEYQLWYYGIVSGVLAPFTWFLKRFDCIPLIFGFMLSVHFERVLSQFISIYVL